jgi:hypothetical protein
LGIGTRSEDGNDLRCISMVSFFWCAWRIWLWYGVAMKMYEDANIPIQSWIFATISMGTLEDLEENGRLLENGNNDKGGCGWYGVCETVVVTGRSKQDTVSRQRQ